jgi:hypothetical protein
MDAKALESLAERITRLESENRRQKRVLAAAGIAAAAAVMLGTNLGRPAHQVEAERFVLKSADGQARATLGLVEGQPALSLLDGRGRDQVVLRSGFDRSSSLEFRDHGRVRMALSSSSVGASTLHFYDAAHRVASGIYATREGDSGVLLNGRRGGLHAGVRADGSTLLSLSDPIGRRVGGWSLGPEGALTQLTSSMGTARPANAPTVRPGPLGEGEPIPADAIKSARRFIPWFGVTSQTLLVP